MDPAIYNMLGTNRKPRFRRNKKCRMPLAGYKDHPSVSYEMKDDFTPSACINCTESKDSTVKHFHGVRNVLQEKPRITSLLEVSSLVKLHGKVRTIQVNEGQLDAMKLRLTELSLETLIFVADSFSLLDRAVLWRIFNLCGQVPFLVEESVSSWEHQIFKCSQDIVEEKSNLVCLGSFRDSSRHFEVLAQLERVSFVPVSIAWDIQDLKGKRTARVNFGHSLTLEDINQKLPGQQFGTDLWRYIEAHLRYDIDRNRPIMPTSLTALMKHFGLLGPGTSEKQAKEIFDGLVYDIRSRGYDLGFNGTTEHVLQYSRMVVEHSWNRVDRFGTAWSAAGPFLCYALMVSAMFSILGGALLSEEEPELKENELLDVFKELLELFKYEAQLIPPCLKEEKRFAETLHWFVKNGVLSCKKEEEMEETEDERRARRIARHFDDEVDYDDMYYNPPAPVKPPEISLFVNRENLRRHLWMYKIWAPVTDAYYETALALLRLLDSDVMEDEDFIRLVVEEIRSKLDKKLLCFEEAASTVFIRNALRFFRDIEILDSYTHSAISVIYLQPLAKEEDVIFDLTAQIGKFRF